MEKMLFISTHFPSKLGGVRRLYNSMLHFSRQFEIHFIRIKISDEPELAKIELPKAVKFSQISAKKIKFDPFCLMLVPSCWKSAVLIGGASGLVQQYIDKNGIDAVNIHAIDTVFGLRSLKANMKIGDVVDSVSNYYASKSRSMKGMYPQAMEFWQGLSYGVVESIIDKNFDLVVFVSERDRQTSHIKKKKIVLSDLRDKPAIRKNLGKRGNEVIIYGKWDHPPNRDGLKKIAGRLGEIEGSVVIAGPGLKSGMILPANTKTAGFVEDIGQLLADSKICLIPVEYGAGLQNKVFDALAQGCKVVTTDFTKKSFEANGLFSDSIASADDVIKVTNTALKNYKKRDAAMAYGDYRKFYSKSLDRETEYAETVRRFLKSAR